MIKIVVVYVLLSVSIVAPSMLLVSLPVTYLAVSSWCRRTRARRDADRLRADAQRTLAQAQRTDLLHRTLRGWS